jgi:hypothetical protein
MATSAVGETAAAPPRRRRTPAGLLDAATIAGCWAFIAFLSTAQRWTWLNTPDAEFYATLGLFGNEVTDRTVTPVYYWTRLGTIGPVRALTEVLGPWTGYYVFWLLLIAVIVIAVFLMVRRFTTRFVSALLALLACLSTVILAFLGNPYVTGTAMAAMFVVIAATMWTLPNRADDAPERRGPRLAAPLLIGLAFGWLAMTNPNATFMTAAVWFVATILITAQRRSGRIRHLLRTVPLVVVGAAASFLALLTAGRVIFPGLDWVQTYLVWSRTLNLAAYVSDAWAFTRDISIVVPLTIMATVFVVLLVRPHDPVLRVAAALSPTAFGFTVLLVLLNPNGTLEVGHYQSLQWPPALCGLSLAIAVVVGRRSAGAWAVVAGAAAVVLTIVAGHRVGTMSLTAGWLLALVTAALLVASLTWLSRTRTGSRRTGVALVAVVAATGVLLAGFQLLQNARRPTGVMAEGLYSNAYNANDSAARLTSSRDAEAWLIDQTTTSDTVMVWVDADWASGEQTLLSMAAFQIWGANQVTAERTLDQTGLDNARAANASVFAMYGKSMAPIVSFWSSIPREIQHSDPECSTYPWPDPAVPTAYVCLTKLTWP